MRHASQTDQNHAEIAQAFRGMGCSVLDLRLQGGGCPDLIVATNGLMAFVEIKAPAGPRGGTSHRNLSEKQLQWRKDWHGPSTHVVRSVQEAVDLVKAMRAA